MSMGWCGEGDKRPCPSPRARARTGSWWKVVQLCVSRGRLKSGTLSALTGCKTESRPEIEFRLNAHVKFGRWRRREVFVHHPRDARIAYADRTRASHRVGQVVWTGVRCGRSGCVSSPSTGSAVEAGSGRNRISEWGRIGIRFMLVLVFVSLSMFVKHGRAHTLAAYPRRRHAQTLYPSTPGAFYRAFIDFVRRSQSVSA